MTEREQLIGDAVARGVKLLATGKFSDVNPFEFVAALAYDKVPDVTVGEVRAAVDAEAAVRRSVAKVLAPPR